MSTFNLEPDGSISEDTRKAYVEHLHTLIDEWSINAYPAEHRNHLGASIIGDNCARKLFYTYRWVKLEQHKGRMRRLFSRGHKEEPFFVRMLQEIGFKVYDRDPQTGKQFKLSAVNGHYGGSGDSKAIPVGLPIEILLEFKTHNDKSFLYVFNNGLIKGKPQHYSQMSSYGRHLKLRYGLYCAVNKNDDDLFLDFVELDWNKGIELENKASDIIGASFPPSKISTSPAYFDCRYCNFQGICHYNEPVEKNCRSCKYSKPSENGTWHCIRFNDIIPKDFIPKGCEYHVSINE